jgi:coenzyme F420 hydrogenase subunit beta
VPIVPDVGMGMGDRPHILIADYVPHSGGAFQTNRGDGAHDQRIAWECVITVRNRQTIVPVVKRKLCTGCGTCVGICPRGALEMVLKKGRYVARLDKERCNRCGLCYEACPGHGVDFEGLSAALFGDIPEDTAAGRYLACYVGHAMDKGVRYNGASGGIVSSLLVFALQEGLIDGALVTRMCRDDPLTPEPFIARTREEILSAAGSKYCPVAANTALREVLDSDDRIAVVGLPCHIQGLRKAEQRIPKLAQQIRYHISLACSLNFSFLGTARFLRNLGIDPDSVAALQYRGRGWPGRVLIRLKDGTRRTVPYSECYRELGPYSLRRCTLCSDMLGELSDLTCGDAWIPQILRTDRAGSSFVVSRTSEAEELLESAALRRAIELSELDLPDLLTSQGHALFKKRKLRARLRLFRLAGQSVPVYRQKLLPPARVDYLSTIKLYAVRFALSGNHRLLRGLFRLAHLRRRGPVEVGAQPV